MPCNLAITITKASINEERLLALLTPDALATALRAYFQARGLTEAYATSADTFQIRMGYGGVRFEARIGSMTVAGSISRGRVDVSPTNRANARAAEQLAEELSQLVAGLADTLFGQKVAAALGALGAARSETVTIEDEGRTQIATQVQLRIQF